MDNPAFTDPAGNGPCRKLARSVSVATAEVTDTMSLYKTASLLRWRRGGPNVAAIDQTEDDGGMPGQMAVAVDPSSDHFEYMECGPSPPAESPPNIYESFEEPGAGGAGGELTVQICSDTIRLSLLEHWRAVSVARPHVPEELESKKTTAESLGTLLGGASVPELNAALLWAAFCKRWDLLDELLSMGASVHHSEPAQGLSALHLAAFSGCIPGTQFLLARGANPNLCAKCYTPLHCAAFGDSAETAQILLASGARVSALTSSAHNCHEGVLHCAVRANAVQCVRMLVAEGADPAAAGPAGVSPLHLAADLGHAQCLRALLAAACTRAKEGTGAPLDVDARTRDRGASPLHLAAEGGYAECVRLLLEAGADGAAKNRRGQTALHLAARAQAADCVDALLNAGRCEPDAGDCDRRTALHAAVGKAARSHDIVELLVAAGADVNARDQYGYTPLHIAALNELSQCVELLLQHGADVTAKSKFGMSALGIVTRKTPASLAVVTQRLDAAITLHQHADSPSREAELRLDFRHILQHCHPREVSFLDAFVDEGQKEILLHPLCAAFLHLKWDKIRKYYIARILFSFAFVFCLSLYVLTALAHNCYNHGKSQVNGTAAASAEREYELCEKKSMMGNMLRNNPFAIEMQWFVLVGITACDVVRKLYGLLGYPNLRQYLAQRENIIEWLVIASVFVISFIYTGRTYTWQNHVGAFAVLFGWTNLMLMVGQLPVFGSYVAMYTRVQGEFAKLLLAYSCLLIGFTISFCVIFPDSSTFANPFIGLITVLVMMTGELSLDLLTDDDPVEPPVLLEISAQVTYILFLLFVTVVLMNLLVGIAVHDIQGLQKTAGLSKLVRQTKLISYMELALFNGYLPRWLLGLLHWTALVSPTAYRVVLNVKPLNPREKRLPRDILRAAYEVAQRRSRGACPTGLSGAGVLAPEGASRLSKNADLGSPILHTVTGATNIFTTSSSAIVSDAMAIGFDTLRHRVEQGADQVKALAGEVRDLRTALTHSHQLVEQLLAALAHKNNSTK